eukprot:gnl/MRDRNA2_/MRDRNA2_78267_c0_seq1.p1 gnl/MRDRNA2_/MRDRNA2_78267_c0~~gnl/MRDRNA2_/MRDRNA2_78267_c0_seq1.p1  ORF type:complete len:800 (+),score=69.71 gnl/MRDRNA2_/MRDRNA2_78267_c0_seq1:166-2400(+)
MSLYSGGSKRKCFAKSCICEPIQCTCEPQSNHIRLVAVNASSAMEVNDDIDLAIFANLTELRRLTLRHALSNGAKKGRKESRFKGSLDSIAHLVKMSVLELYGSGIHGNLKKLSHWKSLEKLSLVKTRIEGSTDDIQLSNMQTLNLVSGGDTPSFHVNLVPLNDGGKLVRLKLQSVNLTGTIAALSNSALISLEMISIASQDMGRIEELDNVGNLTSLNLSAVNIRGVLTTFLSKVPQLRRVAIAQTLVSWENLSYDQYALETLKLNGLRKGIVHLDSNFCQAFRYVKDVEVTDSRVAFDLIHEYGYTGLFCAMKEGSPRDGSFCANSKHLCSNITSLSLSGSEMQCPSDSVVGVRGVELKPLSIVDFMITILGLQSLKEVRCAGCGLFGNFSGHMIQQLTNASLFHWGFSRLATLDLSRNHIYGFSIGNAIDFKRLSYVNLSHNRELTHFLFWEEFFLPLRSNEIRKKKVLEDIKLMAYNAKVRDTEVENTYGHLIKIATSDVDSFVLDISSTNVEAAHEHHEDDAKEFLHPEFTKDEKYSRQGADLGYICGEIKQSVLCVFGMKQHWRVNASRFAPLQLCVCREGYFGRGTNCTKCSGTAFSGQNQTECTSCPRGSYILEEGSRTSSSFCACDYDWIFDSHHQKICSCPHEFVKVQSGRQKQCVNCRAIHLDCLQKNGAVKARAKYVWKEKFSVFDRLQQNQTADGDMVFSKEALQVLRCRDPRKRQRCPGSQEEQHLRAVP